MTTRREAIYMLGAAFALADCNSDDSSATLIVGTQKGSTRDLFTAARVLENQGLKIEWAEFSSSQLLLEAVSANAVDVGLVGDIPFQFAYQNGNQLRIISVERTEPQSKETLAIIVLPTSPITQINDLKGKRIATTRGSSGHYLLLEALRTANLRADQLDIIFLTPGDAKVALSSGSIDAWSIWTPYLTASLAEGAKDIFDGQGHYSGYAFFVSSPNSIEKKRHQLIELLRLEQKSSKWAHNNIMEYARAISKSAGLSIAIALDMAEKVSNKRAVGVDHQFFSEQNHILNVFRQYNEIGPGDDLKGAIQLL